jgi:hypothetical protein
MSSGKADVVAQPAAGAGNFFRFVASASQSVGENSIESYRHFRRDCVATFERGRAMKTRAIAIALVMSMLSPGAAAAAPLKSPGIPTLRAADGQLYKAGQACPVKDASRLTHSTGTTILMCEHTSVTGRTIDYYWAKITLQK